MDTSFVRHWRSLVRPLFISVYTCIPLNMYIPIRRLARRGDGKHTQGLIYEATEGVLTFFIETLDSHSMRDSVFIE